MELQKEFHPDSPKTRMRLTIAECTVENSW
jgi:hypothetical protein